MGSNTPTAASITNFCRSESLLSAPRNILRESIHRDLMESCHHSHRNCKKLSAQPSSLRFLCLLCVSEVYRHLEIGTAETSEECAEKNGFVYLMRKDRYE